MLRHCIALHSVTVTLGIVVTAGHAQSANSSATPTVLVSNQTGATALYVDKKYVYWATAPSLQEPECFERPAGTVCRSETNLDGTVRRVAKSGGAREVVADKLGDVRGLITNNDTLLVSVDNACSGYQCFPDSHLIARDGGVTTTDLNLMAGDNGSEGPASAGRLLTYGTTVLLVKDYSMVGLLPPAAQGGSWSQTPAPAALNTGVSSGDAVIDDSFVYYSKSATCKTKQRCKTAKQLMRKALAGGQEEPVAGPYDQISAIAVDERKAFYWADGKLLSVAKTGGIIATLWSSKKGSTALAVDDDSIYFIVEKDVLKLPKPVVLSAAARVESWKAQLGDKWNVRSSSRGIFTVAEANLAASPGYESGWECYGGEDSSWSKTHRTLIATDDAQLEVAGVVAEKVFDVDGDGQKDLLVNFEDSCHVLIGTPESRAEDPPRSLSSFVPMGKFSVVTQRAEGLVELAPPKVARGPEGWGPVAWTIEHNAPAISARGLKTGMLIGEPERMGKAYVFGWQKGRLKFLRTQASED